MSQEPKHFYVPWQGYMDGEAAHRPSQSKFDTLCLQGPYTYSKAVEIASQLRGEGLYASVIDASGNLKWNECGDSMWEALDMIRLLLSGNPDKYSIEAALKEAVNALKLADSAADEVKRASRERTLLGSNAYKGKE